ncbi:MAG: 2'-5' RNA ligase family protein [Actinomycetes bacterium]
MHTWTEKDGGRPGEAVVIGVAIAIPQPYGDELTRWRRDFGDPLALNIPPHVTLLPPTEIDPATLPEVRRHLMAVAAGEKCFDIRLRGTGTFRPVSPVVFVQLSEGIAECEQLERRVRAGVLDRRLKFYYHPHVTVAHHLEDAALDRAYETLSDYQVTFRVDSFELFEHGDDGVWRPAERFGFDAVVADAGRDGTAQ